MKDIKHYYSLLQIEKTASGEEIKKAYRELALKYHPDLNQSSDGEEKFKKVNEAYSVLSDSEKKMHYDLYGSVPRGRPGTANDFAGRPGTGFGRGMGRGCGCGRMGRGFGPWGGVFRNGKFNIIMDGDDYVCKISLSPEELTRGTTRVCVIRDSSGTKKVNIEIPPGSKRGERIIAAEVAGEGAGKFIVEIQ